MTRTKKQSTEAAVREIRGRTRRKFAPEGHRYYSLRSSSKSAYGHGTKPQGVRSGGVAGTAPRAAGVTTHSPSDLPELGRDTQPRRSCVASVRSVTSSYCDVVCDFDFLFRVVRGKYFPRTAFHHARSLRRSTCRSEGGRSSGLLEVGTIEPSGVIFRYDGVETFRKVGEKR